MTKTTHDDYHERLGQLAEEAIMEPLCGNRDMTQEEFVAGFGCKDCMPRQRHMLEALFKILNENGGVFYEGENEAQQEENAAGNYQDKERQRHDGVPRRPDRPDR